jgi:asparagine synthase (glutamine-hydrolysing)
MLLGELESVMESSVKLAATSDVPIGVFLSGGIDSSLITAFLAKGGKIDIKTFTSWTPDGPNYDERKFAKLIANRFQTQHQEFSVSEKDVLEDIAKLVYYQDQPDGGALETYFISQKAKGLKVAISGTGGDELFGGYHNEVYNSSNLARMYNFSPKLLRKFLISSLSSVFSKKKDFFRIVDEFLSKRSLEERRFYLFFPYSDEEKYSLISKEWLAKEDIVTTLDYFSDFYQRVKDIHPIDRFSYLDLKLYTPTNILQNIDKSAMAHSLEVRSPFLDQRLIEFAAKVPPNLKRRGNIGKYIVKEMAKNILPKEVITHKKTGFGLPRGRYMRGRLKPIIRQFLSEDNLRKRGIFNIPYVNTILSTLDSDNPKLYKDNMKIWLLFILEVWFRIYLDNKITDPDKIKLQDLL